MPELAPLGARDPRALGGYTIVRRLGIGAQGCVYLGEPADGPPVAIKVLHGEWARDPELRARFAREAEAARRVDAFCTARILDARTDGEAPYIVSEYVPGPSLRAAVTADGPYHRDRLYRLAVGTATALAAIHKAGIVHRDFKPDNVLLGPDGPRVIDFGVAKSGPHADRGGATGYVTVGTPSYMAPEQATGDPVGPPADLFAWAEVIVFAATGRPPYGDDSAMAVATRLISEAPNLTGVDASLHDIVAACLSRDPSTRPTASEVLLHLLGHQTRPLTPSVLTEGARAATGDPTAPASAPTAAPLGPPGDPSAPPSSPPAPPGAASAPPGTAAPPGASSAPPWGASAPPGAASAAPSRHRGARSRPPFASLGGKLGRGRRRLVGGLLAGVVVVALAVTGLLVFRGHADPDRKPGAPVAVRYAGSWRGVIHVPGSVLRLVSVQVAADGRTARLFSPSSRCLVSLRKVSGTAYAPASASSCTWARDARLVPGTSGALTLSAGAAKARLARPATAIPKAFTGRWAGRIRPANLPVDLTLGVGARPGVWRSRGYLCRGTLSVWQSTARRLVLVSDRSGDCAGRPDALVLTRGHGSARRLAYRQFTAAGATAQRGTLHRDG